MELSPHHYSILSYELRQMIQRRKNKSRLLIEIYKELCEVMKKNNMHPTEEAGEFLKTL